MSCQQKKYFLLFFAQFVSRIFFCFRVGTYSQFVFVNSNFHTLVISLGWTLGAFSAFREFTFSLFVLYYCNVNK